MTHIVAIPHKNHHDQVAGPIAPIHIVMAISALMGLILAALALALALAVAVAVEVMADGPDKLFPLLRGG